MSEVIEVGGCAPPVVASAADRRLPDFIATLRADRASRTGGSIYASDNVFALLDRLDNAEKALKRLSTFETMTPEGWGFSHPEITARVEAARAHLSQYGERT